MGRNFYSDLFKCNQDIKIVYSLYKLLLHAQYKYKYTLISVYYQQIFIWKYYVLTRGLNNEQLRIIGFWFWMTGIFKGDISINRVVTMWEVSFIEVRRVKTSNHGITIFYRHFPLILQSFAPNIWKSRYQK